MNSVNSVEQRFYSKLAELRGVTRIATITAGNAAGQS